MPKVTVSKASSNSYNVAVNGKFQGQIFNTGSGFEFLGFHRRTMRDMKRYLEQRYNSLQSAT